MTELKNEIAEGLKKQRPNLSESSLRTYASILNSLYKKFDGEDGIKFFDKQEEIIDDIRKLEKTQSKKTGLSGISR